ncbi:thiamine pyrophosphate-dependent dehydrogenase E1 component subunit alpha [Roseovarius spongiae]|uniref:Thiamine pyrophosphate-dependent dehydrogenase E1 component subunit alpha n=1 Tax=Roseovarius spongiae TaxID=2320272 RepID=A0A3A8B747_9RHOB|nr:thiamine pyrophosphate-dependent dehydrogenase E1 component subunit alpha [Roseovarius spongiae]RKF12413.1 thiamine pyrophosphate-dependent dehydrogenase E1 component subunit alpha [Roseovarius spongiae]
MKPTFHKLHRSTLGDLVEPGAYRDPVRIGNRSREALLEDLACMLRIRKTEEQVGTLAEQGIVKTPIHLAIGQEAIPVGLSRHLRPSDAVFGGHRSHAHYLALGGDLDGLIAEIMCRETGVASGRGGSMHLIDRARGFAGSVPLVGATIPLGVGAALALKMDGQGGVGVCYFGDGACEEGVLHESLNLARVLNAPAIFVAENNLYSSHLDIAQRQPNDRLARFAEAHDMRARTVDGNDVCAVAAAAEELVGAARAGDGPGFLEVITYRWRGHVGPDANIDVGLRRSATEVAAWKKRDPIARLASALIADGALDEAGYDVLKQQELERVNAAIAAAEGAGFPDPATLLDHVYSEGA